MKEKRILILGASGVGKDTVANMLDCSYVPSTAAAARLFLFSLTNSLLPHARRYAQVTDMLRDKRQFRQLWFEAIKTYNAADGARLVKIVMQRYDTSMYVGLRDHREFEACLYQGLFDVVLVVERDGIPPDPTYTIDVMAAWRAQSAVFRDVAANPGGLPEPSLPPRLWTIPNNGTLEELSVRVREFRRECL